MAETPQPEQTERVIPVTRLLMQTHEVRLAKLEAQLAEAGIAHLDTERLLRARIAALEAVQPTGQKAPGKAARPLAPAALAFLRNHTPGAPGKIGRIYALLTTEQRSESPGDVFILACVLVALLVAALAFGVAWVRTLPYLDGGVFVIGCLVIGGTAVLGLVALVNIFDTQAVLRALPFGEKALEDVELLSWDTLR